MRNPVAWFALRSGYAARTKRAAGMAIKRFDRSPLIANPAAFAVRPDCR